MTAFYKSMANREMRKMGHNKKKSAGRSCEWMNTGDEELKTSG